VGHQKLYYQYVECDPTKEIGEIRMSVNLPPLKTWQEFFNFEATRIVDLNPGEITERIKDYKKIQDAVKAFEHACVVRLKDVVGAERHRVLIEELHYESPADSIPKFGAGEKPKKSERMSKSERAMREAAKLLGVTVEELQSHARTNTRAKYKTIEEAINVKCDKCGCSKCNDCGDCHICLSLVSCVVKE
jgi:hypothetical protein